MEIEKKLIEEKMTINALTRAIETQDEHNLLLGECLTLLKKSMINLHGSTAPGEIKDFDSPAIESGRSPSLVERLNASNNVRSYLLSEIYSNLKLMETESVIQN